MQEHRLGCQLTLKPRFERRVGLNGLNCGHYTKKENNWAYLYAEGMLKNVVIGFSMLVPLPILIVEDNNINREVAILQLRALEFTSETAANGNEAVEAIKKRQFALILMDVMMPSMDGWEASRRIREYEESIGRHTPIIAVSAWSAADNKERCLLAGMDDYLGKPYDRASLKQILERWVSVEISK